MEVMHGLALWTSTPQGWPGYCHDWVFNLQVAEPKTAPGYSTFLQSTQPGTWWQADHTGPLWSWKGQCFVLIGRDTYSGYEFFFPASMLLPKLPSVDSLNALSAIMVLSIALLLIKEPTSQQKKYGNGPLLIPCSDHVSKNPKTASLVEWWNSLLKTEVQCQLGGSILPGQGSSDGCIWFESASNIWYCFYSSQDSWVQELRGGNGIGTACSYPWWHTNKSFCFQSLQSMCSAGLEVLVPKGGIVPSGNITMIHWTGS